MRKTKMLSKRNEEPNMKARKSRQGILDGMRQKIAAGQGLLITGAGNGMVARIADQCSVDGIVVYNSGRYRMDGLPSIAGNLPIGDANQIVYDMGKHQILNRVEHTPVMAGVYGVDPTRDMERFLTELYQLGYSGAINFPTVGKLSGTMRSELEQVGLGFDRELEMLRTASRLGMVTMAYCYCEEEAVKIASAGVDILISHSGLTSGGDVGLKRTTSLEETISFTQRVLSAAKRENPQIIALCHGGIMQSPDMVNHILAQTCAEGFVGSSSIERIATEQTLRTTIKEYMNLKRGNLHE